MQQQVAAPVTTSGAPAVTTTAPGPVVATAAASAAPTAGTAADAVAAPPAVATSKGEEVSAAAVAVVVAGGDGSFETKYKHPLFDVPVPAFQPSTCENMMKCYYFDVYCCIAPLVRYTICLPCFLGCKDNEVWAGAGARGGGRERMKNMFKKKKQLSGFLMKKTNAFAQSLFCFGFNKSQRHNCVHA